MYYLGLSALLNAYVWFGGEPRPTLSPVVRMLLVILGATLIGHLTKVLTARRVRGNNYLEHTVTRTRRMVVLTVTLAVAVVLAETGLDRYVLTSPVAATILLSFLFASLLTLGWLIRYESSHGVVYIVEVSHGSSGQAGE